MTTIRTISSWDAADPDIVKIPPEGTGVYQNGGWDDKNAARVQIMASTKIKGASCVAHAIFRAENIYAIEAEPLSKTVMLVRFGYRNYAGDYQIIRVEIYGVARISLDHETLCIHVKGSKINGVFKKL